MSAADLGGHHKEGGVARQLAIAVAEHVAGKDDPRVGRRLERRLVFVGVGGVADDHEPQPGLEPRERLEQDVSVVLGHQAAHEEDVVARLQPEALELAP